MLPYYKFREIFQEILLRYSEKNIFNDKISKSIIYTLFRQLLRKKERERKRNYSSLRKHAMIFFAFSKSSKKEQFFFAIKKQIYKQKRYTPFAYNRLRSQPFGILCKQSHNFLHKLQVVMTINNVAATRNFNSREIFFYIIQKIVPK